MILPYRHTEFTRKKREDRRKSLIESARYLFSTNGYENTTVKHIVKEAGTSIGNFYFYFQTKEELLLSVAKEINDAVFLDIELLADPKYTAELNSAIYIYTFTRHWYNNLEIARILIQGQIDLDTRNRLLSMHKEKLIELTFGKGTIIDRFPLDILIAAWQGIWLGVLELKLHDTDNSETEYWAYRIIEISLSAAGCNSEILTSTLDDLKKITKNIS